MGSLRIQISALWTSVRREAERGGGFSSYALLTVTVNLQSRLSGFVRVVVISGSTCGFVRMFFFFVVAPGDTKYAQLCSKPTARQGRSLKALPVT